MKRKWAYGTLALLATVGAICLLWPRNPVSRASYDKIQLGMTLAEAERAVGRPSIPLDEWMDEMVKRHVRFHNPEPQSIVTEGNDWSQGPRPDLRQLRCWAGLQGGLTIQLNDDGRVIGKRFEGPAIPLEDQLRLSIGF